MAHEKEQNLARELNTRLNEGERASPFASPLGYGLGLSGFKYKDLAQEAANAFYYKDDNERRYNLGVVYTPRDQSFYQPILLSESRNITGHNPDHSTFTRRLSAIDLLDQGHVDIDAANNALTELRRREASRIAVVEKYMEAFPGSSVSKDNTLLTLNVDFQDEEKLAEFVESLNTSGKKAQMVTEDGKKKLALIIAQNENVAQSVEDIAAVKEAKKGDENFRGSRIETLEGTLDTPEVVALRKKLGRGNEDFIREQNGSIYIETPFTSRDRAVEFRDALQYHWGSDYDTVEIVETSEGKYFFMRVDDIREQTNNDGAGSNNKDAQKKLVELLQQEVDEAAQRKKDLAAFAERFTLGTHKESLVAMEHRHTYYFEKPFINQQSAQLAADSLNGNIPNLASVGTVEGKPVVILDVSKLDEDKVAQFRTSAIGGFKNIRRSQLEAEKVQAEQAAQMQVAVDQKAAAKKVDDELMPTAQVTQKDNLVTIVTSLQYEQDQQEFLRAFSRGGEEFASGEMVKDKFVVTLNLDKKPDNYTTLSKEANDVLERVQERIENAAGAMNFVNKGVTADGVVLTTPPIGEEFATQLAQQLNEANGEDGGRNIARTEKRGDQFVTIIDPTLIAPGIKPETLEEMKTSIGTQIDSDKAAKQKLLEEKETRLAALLTTFGAMEKKDGSLVLSAVFEDKAKAEAIVKTWNERDKETVGAISVVDGEKGTYRIAITDPMKVDPAKAAPTLEEEGKGGKHIKDLIDAEMKAQQKEKEEEIAFEQRLKDQEKQKKIAEEKKKEDEEKRKNSRNSIINWAIPLIVGIAGMLILGGGGITIMGVVAGLAVAGAASLVTQNVTGSGFFAPKKPTTTTAPGATAADETERAQEAPGNDVTSVRNHLNGLNTEGIVMTGEGASTNPVASEVKKATEEGVQVIV